jgi:hypothetical protein
MSSILSFFDRFQRAGQPLQSGNGVVLPGGVQKGTRCYVLGDLDGRLHMLVSFLKDHDFIEVVGNGVDIKWKAKEDVYVVQCGDEIDADRVTDLYVNQHEKYKVLKRNEFDLSPFLLMHYLQHESKGHCCPIIGNHELMNVHGHFATVDRFNVRRMQRAMGIGDDGEDTAGFEARRELFQHAALAGLILRSRHLVLRIANAVFTHAGIVVGTVEEYARLNGLRAPNADVDVNGFVEYVNGLLQQEATFDPSATHAKQNTKDPRSLLFDEQVGILWNRGMDATKIGSAVDPFKSTTRPHLIDVSYRSNVPGVPGVGCPVNLNVLGHNKVPRVETYRYGVHPNANVRVTPDVPDSLQLNVDADYAMQTDTAPVGITAIDHHPSRVNAFEAETNPVLSLQYAVLSRTGEGVGPFDRVEFETHACNRDEACPYFNGLAVLARCMGYARTHAEALRIGEQAEASVRLESAQASADAVRNAMESGSVEARDIARKLNNQLMSRS